MKKFPAILALVLTLIMLAVPMNAMAEPTTATVLQITNPSLSYNGDARSMPGLGLQLALCESADSSLFQLIADVMVNNQNATSAMLQIDNAMNIVGFLGGMSSAYTVNLEELMATAEMNSMMSQIEPLVSSIETWTLPSDITNIITNHFNTFTITDMGVSTNANGVEMQYKNISGDVTNMIIDVLKAIDTDPLLLSFMELANGYPVESLGLADSSDLGNGNGIGMYATLGTDYSGSVIDLDADLVVYLNGADAGIIHVSCDFDSTDISNVFASLNLSSLDNESGMTFWSFDAAANVLNNGFTLNGSITNRSSVIPFNAALVLGDAQDTFTFNLPIDASNSFNVNYVNNKTGAMSGAISASATSVSYGTTTTTTFDANYSITDTGLKLNGKIVANDPYSGASTISLNDLTIDASGLLNFDFSVQDPYGGFTSFCLNGNCTFTDVGMVITGSLNIVDSYSTDLSFTLSELSFDFVNGNYVAAFTYDTEYDDPMSFTLSLTATTPVQGATYSGVLAFTGFDGYSTIGATADINVLTASVDTANFYINPVTAINLMTMTEDQSYTAQSEISTIISNLGNAIMNAYPAIFE